VARRQLTNVLSDFRRTLRQCRRLATDAHLWSLPGSVPHISRVRRDSMIELAFLRMYLGWETFLEDSFVSYLVGAKPPRGRPPHRFTIPPTRRDAEEWVIPEDREYAKWDAPHVSSRALRFFRRGHPFTNALRSNQNLLEETRKIRNAVAHESTNAYEKFETIVRTKLGLLPPHLTVGAFLIATVPASALPQSFLEFYFDRVESVAEQIIPS